MSLKITVDALTRSVKLGGKELLKAWATGVDVELYFTEEGSYVRRGASAYIKAGIKARADFTGDLLASVETWTRGATDDDPYTGALDLNGADLITAIANETTLNAHLEIYWEDPEGDDPERSAVAPIPISNALNQPTDATPTPSVALGKAMQPFLAAGTNVTLDKNTTTGVTTINSDGGGGGSGSLRIKYASSVAALDSTFSGGGTDDTDAIQGLLTGGGIELVIDGVARVSGLDVESDTVIRCLPGCGFYLANASNRSLLRNLNQSTGAITDAGVELIGGRYEGNSEGQTNSTPNREADGTVMAVLQFAGVEDIRMRGVTISNSRAYGALFGNVDGVFIDGIRVDNGDSDYVNRDGIHFLGNSFRIQMFGLDITAHDDALAFNADDVDHGPRYIAGPIRNVQVDGLFLNDSLLGLRLLSGENEITRVQISNVTGRVHNYAGVLNKFTFDVPGSFGSITLENWDVQLLGVVSGTAGFDSPALLNFDGAFERLTLKNIQTSGWPDDRDLLWFHEDTDIKLLNIEGASVRSTDAASVPSRLILLEGNVDRLVLNGANFVNDTAELASAVVEVDGGSVGELVMSQCSANDFAIFVNAASGAVEYAQASCIRHSGTSTATFYLSGTTSDIVVSNWYGLGDLLLTTGTADSRRGDGFDSEPPPAVVDSIVDDFTDTNGTALASHTIAPTNLTVPVSWVVHSGVLQIQGNKVVSDGAQVTHLASVAYGISAMKVTATVTYDNSTGLDQGVVARLSNGANYLAAFLYNSTFYIAKYSTGGGEEVLDSTPVAVTQGNPYVIVFTASGSSLTATLDGGDALNATDSFNIGATKAGVRLSYAVATPGAVSAVDTFRVEAP